MFNFFNELLEFELGPSHWLQQQVKYFIEITEKLRSQVFTNCCSTKAVLIET